MTEDIKAGSVARATDPDTSHAAGATATKAVGESCAFVLVALRALGPTDDESLQAYYDRKAADMGWPPQRCVRKRRHDLVLAGKVKYSGRKVKNSVGLNVREWEAT